MGKHKKFIFLIIIIIYESDGEWLLENSHTHTLTLAYSEVRLMAAIFVTSLSLRPFA